MAKHTTENFPSVVHIKIEKVEEVQDHITVFMAFLEGPFRGQRFTSVLDLPNWPFKCSCCSPAAKTRRTNG